MLSCKRHCSSAEHTSTCQGAGDGLLKIADFGLAIKASDAGPYAKRQRGTLPFSAPEALNKRLCQASDTYALALLLYFVVMGRHPFGVSLSKTDADHTSWQPPTSRS